MNKSGNSWDFILVGGGLQAGLLALAIHHYKPNAKVVVLEKQQYLFGNHTWSFHGRDISREWKWLDRLSLHQWPGYTVHFPEFDRQVDLAYCSFSSQKLSLAIESLVREKGNPVIRTGMNVVAMTPHRVTTSEGGEFVGETVIDCRGRNAAGIRGAGFQKFYGVELELDRDWPDRLPVLMEANVDQTDGYRFLYVLPFDRRRVLVEDTHFSESSALDKGESLRQIHSYLVQKSILNWKVLREDEGCLPMPFTSSIQPRVSDLLAGGFAGGWFHAATGYSFSLAARFADTIASCSPDDARGELKRFINDHRFQIRFTRILNRLLFRMVSPDRRFEIFRRFYRRLPDATIQRFYAHTFTPTDAARILIGSPPGGLTPVRFLQSFRGSPCPA